MLTCPNCKQKAMTAWGKFFISDSETCKNCHIKLTFSNKHHYILHFGIFTPILFMFLILESNLAYVFLITVSIIYMYLHMKFVPLVIAKEPEFDFNKFLEELHNK